MPNKAIFAQSTLEFWIDVAARLRDVYAWQICCFVGSPKQKEKVSQLFHHTPLYTKDEIRKNLIPGSGQDFRPSAIDKQLLTALSVHESIFLKIMDRLNYNGSLSYYERISAYHRQLMFWKGLLENFKPDVVVFRIAPHTGHDYSLYALCRIMDIPTVMFERASLPGFVYPVRSFEEASEEIKSAYAEALKKQNIQGLSLTPETLSHLENLSKSYDQAMPFHLRYKLKHFKKEGAVGGTLSILLRLATTFAYWLLLKKRDSDYLYTRYHKKMGLFQRKKLLAHYNRLVKEVNLDDPYIFVALQCEPERQTCPVGGVFSNQYLMVDLLSKLAPKNWKIYVKEHVSQFKEYQAAERSRTFEFYDWIASMPKVELVPLTYTSFELIDHAKASASVSGTVGWESVVRGKPALLFGHSWYKYCKGVFVTHTVDACKEAIREIQSGYQADMDEVRCFAHVVERCSTKGYIDKLYDKMNIISPEENIKNLAKAIHEFIN